MWIQKVIKAFLAITLAALFASGGVFANERGTPAEAEALVKKAVAYIKTNGQDKALDEFTNGKSFKDRDLYIIVFDMNGKNLAHGANSKLVGKDLSGLKDPDGKMIFMPLLEIAKTKGKGWSEPFRFRNPLTEKMETKLNYVEKFGELIVGCGIYQ